MEEINISQDKKRGKNGISKGSFCLAKIIGDLVFLITMVFVAVMVFSLVFTKVTGGPPQVAGFRMYIVLSGSMNPAFDAGSLVFVKPTVPEEIKSGDIITYKGLGEEGQLVSHRVVEINNTDDGIKFTTKGDANEALDPNPVSAERLVGKVVLAVPYLGYFMEFTQTRQGIITLILIPAALILLFELRNFYKYLKDLKYQKAVQCKSQREDIKP